MKKIFFILSAVFLSLCLLTSCARGRSRDLSTFVSCFSYRELSVEDFYREKDNNIYYTFLNENDSSVMIKILCNDENIIEQVRVFLPKADSNAKKKEISTRDISLFVPVVSSCLTAYTSCNTDDGEKILREMFLYDKNTYHKKGELTKNQNSFHYSYLSSSLGCEFTVTDTYLMKIEETRKPESRPAFGDTTNIRTQTAPQK